MSFKKWAPAKLITLQYLMIKTLINRWLRKLQYKILLNTKGTHAAQSSNEEVLVNDDDDNTDDDDDDTTNMKVESGYYNRHQVIKICSH